LILPLTTVLDDSIGCALWFAARGKGLLDGMPYTTTARVSKRSVDSVLHAFFLYWYQKFDSPFSLDSDLLLLFQFLFSGPFAELGLLQIRPGPKKGAFVDYWSSIFT